MSFGVEGKRTESEEVLSKEVTAEVIVSFEGEFEKLIR
jgi:hypothetical protein